MKLFGQRKVSPVEGFWNWVVENEDWIYHFESAQEEVFDELNKQLNKVNDALTFEFGPVKNGCRDFVISADGIAKAFPYVESLCSAPPRLSKFNIVRFRPRRSPVNDLTIKGTTIRSNEVFCHLIRDKQTGKIGIVVFLDAYTKEEHSKYARFGYLFLDEALGEYDVETRVGGILFEPKTAPNAFDAFPLQELSKRFDDLLAQDAN